MKIKENSKTHIVGAGIAGMTAAINLSKFGKSVIIYEKKDSIGASRHGDFEGIENWILSKNLPESIAECGIDFNGIPKFPIFEFFVHFNQLKCRPRPESLYLRFDNKWICMLLNYPIF